MSLRSDILVRCTIAVLLLTMVAIVGCSGGTTSAGGGTQVPGTQEESPGDATTIDAASPDTESPFGFHPANVISRGFPDSGFTDARNIGVGWTRQGVYAFWFKVQPDMNKPDYDFSLYDRQWGEVPADIRILANISPQGQRDEGRCLPHSWLPVDEEKYRAFVTATVERYDGDGTGDMPGFSNPIKYWQVGNEPQVGGKSGFADLQRISYEAIKQACPDCRVLIGGVPGQPVGYVKQFDEEFAPYLKELGGKYFDIFDFHWYGKATGDYRLRDAQTGEDVLEHIKASLVASGYPEDIPVWITEMGSYSGDLVEAPAGVIARKAARQNDTQGRVRPDNPLQTERQQAGDYFRRFIYPLSRGVGKVFPAFGLMEGFKHDDGYFDHTGLIYDGDGSGDLGAGVRKLGYYTYKKMTESLEGADWSTLKMLHDGTGGDHLYLFKVMKDGRAVYIAWWDWFDEPGYAAGAVKSITIPDLGSGTLTVTPVVPVAATGQAVTDYASAFSAAAVAIEGTSATVPLGEDPVIITQT